MTGLPTLDPEIADLGLAIGLFTPGTSGGVELDSTWFDNPGERVSGVLATDDRRSALIRFADAVMADGQDTERDGITLLPLFNLRQLANDDTLPDLVVQASLDARPAGYVEVGLAASFATVDPITSTSVVIPLYRAAKAGQTVAQPFALLAGGRVQVSVDLTLDTAPPAVDAFGLAGLAVSVDTALSGTPSPSFTLQLKGLHLPGAADASDIQVGGPGVDISDALLSLVLGLVRQGAESLSGPAADEVGAVLDLLGLGGAAGIPPLPVPDLLEHGVSALLDWFTALMGSETARAAWMDALRVMLGGTMDSGMVSVPIGTGPVSALIGLAVSTGPGGHLRVTPQIGLKVATDVAGAISLGAEASADLLTIDVATGSIDPVPTASFALTATGNGTGNAAKLLHTVPLDVGALRLGLTVVAGHPQALIQLDDVDLEGNHHDVLDLSSPDAVVAAAGQLAGDLVSAALDALGDAGAELKALLGLDPPAGVPALDAALLLTNPLGTLQAWWHDLLTNHSADVPTVLAHLRNLVAGTGQVVLPVLGTGTAADPWSVPVASKFSIDCWLDGSVLTVAPTVSLRTGDLAGGCTTVMTSIRAELMSIDLSAGHVTFMAGVDFDVRIRDTGNTEATLSLGPVALVADYIGLHAGWTPATGFGVEFRAPNPAVISGADRVALVLPTVDGSGHLSVPPASWGSVESLIAVLATSTGRGWLADLVDLAGWTIEGGSALLSLADLVATPGPALLDWLTALTTDGELVAAATAALAHLVGGSSSGLGGVLTGSGTPGDPWLVGLGAVPGLPSIAVHLGPSGPVAAPARAGSSLQNWRPGTDGLPSAGLAQALIDEGGADPEVQLLAAGRNALATGLDALAGRWTGTDGLVGPPQAAIAGLTTVLLPDLDASGLPSLDVASLLPGGLPADAVVVRVAVSRVPTGPTKDLPWTPAQGRLLDLTAPALAPTSFSVTTPATGEWVVALAPRADTSLGVTDPTGVLGQAARLQQVLASSPPPARWCSSRSGVPGTQPATPPTPSRR